MIDEVTHGLTLRQPWATAVTHHGKRLENRARGPGKFLGRRVAIHSGAQKNPNAYLDLEAAGIAPAVGTLRPMRSVIGTARIVTVLKDVVVTKPEDGSVGMGYSLAADATDGAAFADVLTVEQIRRWAIGPVIWVLADVEAFAEPVPFDGGKLGIWPMPDELRAAVAAARPR